MTFAALALCIWIIPLPQNPRQPSTRINKEQRSTDAQLAEDSREKQQATETAALNSVLTAMTKSELERASERDQEAIDEKATLKAEWWLVYVGIAQAIALISTLGFIWYQAKKTAEATQAMRDGLPLQKSAADAALLNAQAAIAAARPWISFFGEYNSGIFTFKAANLGNTPAEVISYANNMAIVDRIENLPIAPIYGRDQIPPFALLTPDHYSNGANITVGTFDTNSIIAPDPQKQTFVFFFRVVYKNPLSSTNSPLIPLHESRMCFWYINGVFHKRAAPENTTNIPNFNPRKDSKGVERVNLGSH